MNITEKATELAHEKTEKYCEKNNIEFLLGKEEECTIYTNEAQKIFADFYDNIYSILQTKQILTKLEEVVQDITNLGKSKGLSLAITNAEQASMWLEIHYMELVVSSPYLREDPSIQIESIADTHKEVLDYVILATEADPNIYFVTNNVKYKFLKVNEEGLNVGFSSTQDELIYISGKQIVKREPNKYE